MHNLLVVGSEVVDGQLHNGMSVVDVNDAAAEFSARLGGHKVAVKGDGPDQDDVQVKVISAVLVQGQEAQAVAQVGDVVGPCPPVGAVEPFLHRRAGHVIDVCKRLTGHFRIFPSNFPEF
jgi:hypothetical protein